MLQIDGGAKQLEPNRRYVLTKINLVRAAAPPEVRRWRQNVQAGIPIIIEKNRPLRSGLPPLGRVEITSYAPPLVVVAGAQRRKKLLDEGVLRTWAWVEAGAVGNATDENVIRPAEFLKMMQAALERTAFRGRSSPLPGQAWPVLIGAYPLHNRMRYQLGERTGMVRYTVAPDGKRLDIVDAGTGYNTLPLHTVPVPSSRDQIDDKEIPKLRKAWGAENSELMLRIVSTWENQREALRMYLDAIQEGHYVPLTPSFAPVPLSSDHKIGTLIESKAGTSLYDFAQWTAAEQDSDTKRFDNQELNRRNFAYVGDVNDKSTWLLPMHTPARVRRAQKQLQAATEIPAEKRQQVLHRIQAAGKRFGLDLAQASPHAA